MRFLPFILFFPPSRVPPCLRSSDYFADIVLLIVLFNSWDILDVAFWCFDVDSDSADHDGYCHKYQYLLLRTPPLSSNLRDRHWH